MILLFFVLHMIKKNKHLNALDWTKTWLIYINPTKSKSIVLTSRTNVYKPELKFNNVNINYVKITNTNDHGFTCLVIVNEIFILYQLYEV